jgi:hypothetical protein
MKKFLLAILLLAFAQVAFAQGSYKLEQGIPYHSNAGEYAAERCVLDFYYPTDI